jgi:hypothetical protein
VARFKDPEGLFELELPLGWSAEPDPEEGGFELTGEDGPGVLHLMAFEQPETLGTDPAEELYSFLAEEGIEIEEEDVEDLDLPDGWGMAVCEFVSEPEEAGEDESLFFTIGVGTAPGILLFATYTCPDGEEEQERDELRGLLGSIRLLPRTTLS